MNTYRNAVTLASQINKLGIYRIPDLPKEEVENLANALLACDIQLRAFQKLFSAPNAEEIIHELNALRYEVGVLRGNIK